MMNNDQTPYLRMNECEIISKFSSIKIKTHNMIAWMLCQDFRKTKYYFAENRIKY